MFIHFSQQDGFLHGYPPRCNGEIHTSPRSPRTDCMVSPDAAHKATHRTGTHTHRLLHMGQLSDIYGSWDKNDLEFSIRGVSYL